jgi:hypothetical protein
MNTSNWGGGCCWSSHQGRLEHNKHEPDQMVQYYPCICCSNKCSLAATAQLTRHVA